MLMSKVKKISEEADTTPDAIKAIEKYEIARSGWVVLLNFLGLEPDSTVDAFCIRMDGLMKAANEGRRVITDKIKSNA